MSRPAAVALALGALLLSACGSSASKLQRLPPAEMREILPLAWGRPAQAPAPAAAPDVLPPVAGAGATAGLQVAPGAAPDAPPPIAAPATAARRNCGRAGRDRVGRVTGLQHLAVQGGWRTRRPRHPRRVPQPVDEAGWPRSFTATGVAFEVHEPQVQRWDGAVLVADAAVVAHPDGQRQPVPGIVRMTARTVVDKAAGTVAVEDLTLTDASFPTARDREPAWLALLRNFAPRSVKRLSLAHLEASARQAEASRRARAAAQAVVPRIIVARNPALLVPIDGEPRFVALPGTRLQGARNTRVVLLKDPAGKLYLRVYNGWLSAASLRGPWAIAEEPPGAVQALQAAAGERACEPADRQA